ncbi:MAG: DUF3536 domain-containing protein [Candidatus Omnitrophica bacterium]|nr:DUF3536 domain-containing protein [Candidatus Omnitrophota bacterium]
MTKLTKTVYLTIHGHFYQPPRENPWTERVELQPDARPFHDWNDRITIQCYQPNAMARIVDSEGKALEMVNNFRLLSFNVGATLLSWLERNSPIVYLRILEGDRLSIKERSGHGNAIAQVYNHMILPLANEREQRTQIRWGIFEFKKRFGRDTEGIWLPETAASERTLEILIEEGVKFTILAPEQAEKIRPLQVEGASGTAKPKEGAAWEDVSQGTIDSTRPYRFFHTKDSHRWIDLFFFHGPLSREMSFGDILFDAKKFAEKLKTVHEAERSHPELIDCVSDGETFGHHKAFGERVITFLLHEEAEKKGFKRTNYGEYLEKFPPQFEVKIKSGEGTSWSCPHGVGRWKENCGCHTGGGEGWDQKWRTPLREAVRFLEKELAEIYEREAKNLFQDPWAARDGYIELILDRSPEGREKFFGRQAAHSLSPEEKIKALKLLEMERFAMLAETSCGWFFNDISGIETVQILRYACRALEIARELGAGDLENPFLGILSGAKSNRSDFGDGKAVWEKFVKPARVSFEKVVSHYAFRKLFELEVTKDDFYNSELEEGEIEQETVGENVLLMGTVCLTHKTLPEPQDFIYAIYQEGVSRVECFVKKLTSRSEFHKMNVAPLSHFRKKDGDALLASLKRSFGGEPFLIRDLFPEERERILWVLSRKMREDLYQTTARFYEENRSGTVLFREAGSPVPEEFRGIMEWMMGERLLEIVEKLETRTSFENIVKDSKALLAEAQARGLNPRVQPMIEFLSVKLNHWIEKLFHEPDPGLVQKIEQVLGLAKELRIELHDRIAQDLFFVFAQKALRERIESYRKDADDGSRLQMIQAIIRLGRQLGFNMKQYENQLAAVS